MTASASMTHALTTRPWFASYAPGVPHSIDDAMGGTINDLFEKAVRDFGANPALESFGVGLFFDRVRALIASG